MKTIAIFAICIVNALAYGYGTHPDIRLTSVEPTIVRSSYVEPAPIIIRSGYEAPLLRTSYEAPVVVRSSYEAPIVRAPHIPIVRYLKNDDNYGTYNMEVETGDGTVTHETGSLRNGGLEGPVNVKEGSYSFTSPEGERFTVNYVADENGYRASGAHLPTPPPIPVEILKSLSLPRVAESLHHRGDYTHSVVRTVPSYGVVESVPAIRLGGY